MKTAMLFSLLLLASCAVAEELVTVTVFKMKDGVVHEALRFAAVGEEGAKTFTLKKTNGERVTVSEGDVVSRTEKKVSRSDLPDSASAAAPASPAPKAKSSEDDSKQAAKGDAVRKAVDTRIALQKIEDELTQAKARLVPIQQAIAEAAAGIAKAQATYDNASKELGGIPDPPKGKVLDPAARDAENKREARREALRKRMASADDEKSKLTTRKTDAETALADANEQIKKITERRDTAQKEAATAAAEKSKAIIAANSDSTSTKQSTDSGDKSVHSIKLKDGTIIRARSITKLPDGVLLVVDETGAQKRIAESDIVSKD